MSSLSNSTASHAAKPAAANNRETGAAGEGDSSKSARAGPKEESTRERKSASNDGVAPPEKAAGVSSRRLSQLQMPHTLQAFSGGRGSTGTAAAQASKQYKQQQRHGSTREGAHKGRGETGEHHQPPPPWRGGSSVSGCKGIDFRRRKAASGAAAHRMCLYGSGALWLPPQQVLAEYAVAPGVAGQPSGRDDLRTLLQEQQHQDSGDLCTQRWRGFNAGGGRRNASSAVAEALLQSSSGAQEGAQQQQDRRAVRSLRSYYSAEELQKAFAQTLKLVDPLTGHMQIMAARKPGFAAAVVNIQNFDAYGSLQMPKPYAALRQKDSLQPGIMVRERSEDVHVALLVKLMEDIISLL